MTKNEMPMNKSQHPSAYTKTKLEDMNGKRRMSTRKLTSLALLSALAAILMFLQTILPLMPSFLMFDISEIPVLLGAFAFGPGSAVMIELIKNLIHLTVTTSAGVGELANFLAGSLFEGTAGIVYHFLKNKKGAVIGMAAGTIVMTIFTSFFNYYFLLPFYANVLGYTMAGVIATGTKVNPNIKDLTSIIIFAFIPFNIFEGIVISALTALLYKRVSPLLHGRKRIVPASSAAAAPITPKD